MPHLEAWFVVDDDHPVDLYVPPISSRYHTAQLLDEWSEPIVRIDDRSTPSNVLG